MQAGWLARTGLEQSVYTRGHFAIWILQRAPMDRLDIAGRNSLPGPLGCLIARWIRLILAPWCLALWDFFEKVRSMERALSDREWVYPTLKTGPELRVLQIQHIRVWILDVSSPPDSWNNRPPTKLKIFRR